MKINVVIATHARSQLLRRTLGSLAQVHRPTGFERVIVVENGSDQGQAADVCRAVASRLPIECHHRAEAGKSRALQWAVERIGDGLVIFFDDDVRLDPNVMTAYAEAAANHDERTFFGGPFECDYQTPPPDWLRPHLPVSAVGWQSSDEPQRQTYYGLNYAVHARAVIDVGGFNPNIGPGALRAGTEGNPTGQETELQQRLLAAGCRSVYVPDAKVWHYVPADRCSPAWALHRKRRGAFTATMNDPAFVQGRTFMGAPRWLWTATVRRWLWAAIMRLHPDPRRRFEAALPFAVARGRLDGARYASRHARSEAQSGRVQLNRDAVHG